MFYFSPPIQIFSESKQGINSKLKASTPLKSFHDAQPCRDQGHKLIRNNTHPQCHLTQKLICNSVRLTHLQQGKVS